MKIKELRRDARQFLLPIKTIQSLGEEQRDLLDIGAGEHYITNFLPKNIKYHSLDNCGEQDFLFDLNKGNLPVENKKFGIILCLETLEHLLYPHKVMKEILKIAKKNTIFLFSLPNEYNFYCRLNFLFGRKTAMQETFMTTEKNLHIHSPRVKDILSFFSKYLEIEEINYQWQSRTSQNKKGFSGILFFCLDKIINLFSKIFPSLFARTVVIRGKMK